MKCPHVGVLYFSCKSHSWVMYLYGTVWSSEESLISRCGHRKGPFDKSLCDASLAPGANTVTLTDYTNYISGWQTKLCCSAAWNKKINKKERLEHRNYSTRSFTLMFCTLAAALCPLSDCTPQRHCMLSRLIWTDRMILEKEIAHKKKNLIRRGT